MSKFLNVFEKNLFRTDHITNDHLKILVGILVIMYIFIFVFMYYYEEPFEKYNRICITSCNKESCQKVTRASRGERYYLSDDSAPYECIFTIWELSHLMMHIFIGYYFNFGYSFGIGTIFEVYEKYHHKCENYLDIVHNSIGGLIGVGIRTYMTL
jgi:hypothetical protein